MCQQNKFKKKKEDRRKHLRYTYISRFNQQRFLLHWYSTVTFRSRSQCGRERVIAQRLRQAIVFLYRPKYRHQALGLWRCGGNTPGRRLINLLTEFTDIGNKPSQMRYTVKSYCISTSLSLGFFIRPCCFFFFFFSESVSESPLSNGHTCAVYDHFIP